MNDLFWIPAADVAPNIRLAIVLRPRGNDWLEDELHRIKTNGVETLVSMLEDWEASSLGLSEESRVASELGLSFVSYPIPDRTTPADLKSFRAVVADLADRLRRGRSVGVHCRGSIGRATIIAAATLIHLGWKAEAALKVIESVRGCSIPDTEEQRRWILGFEVTS